MSEGSGAIDPYEAVLADLRARRNALDIAIATIEAVRSGTPMVSRIASPVGDASIEAQLPSGPSEVTDGTFFGYTVVDASKKLMAIRRKALHINELAMSLKAGGVVMTSKEPANTINSILGRRQSSHGDVVKIGRGTWGLREWYPHTNFKKKEGGKPVDPISGAIFSDGEPLFDPIDEGEV